QENLNQTPDVAPEPGPPPANSQGGQRVIQPSESMTQEVQVQKPQAAVTPAPLPTPITPEPASLVSFMAWKMLHKSPQPYKSSVSTAATISKTSSVDMSGWQTYTPTDPNMK